MSQRLIIFSFLAFLFSGLTFLSFTEMKQAQPNGWWTVYFSDPSGTSLDFAIENYSGKSDFAWEVSDGQETLDHDSLSVKKGETKTIQLTAQPTAKTIAIKVTRGSESRVISKRIAH